MSSRQDRQRNSQQRSRIAALAARLMAEDGISDLALAKRKAARSLGLPESAALPDDSEVEAALRTYQRLVPGEEQQARQPASPAIAARLMATMQRFNPYLTGRFSTVPPAAMPRSTSSSSRTVPRTSRSSCSTSGIDFPPQPAAHRSCRGGADDPRR
jgi:hypothetical protein